MGRAKIGLIVVALWLLVACAQESGVDSAESTPTPTSIPTEPLAAPIIVTEPAPATATPVIVLPTNTPALPTPTPTPSLFETVEIGRTIGGAPIEAERIGHGSFRVVIAATDQPPVQALLDHFRAMPGAVPENVTLWIVHNSDPDGIGGVFTNADSSFDGCFDNSGSERFPFNTVEARALRDVTQSASAVILLDSAENNRILLDTCRQSAPAQQLGTLASGMLNRPLQPLRNTPGHFVDYLSSEGVAAIAIEGGVDAASLPALAEQVMAAADEIVAADTLQLGAATTWLNDGNTGNWRFADGNFIHPLALQLVGDTAYLLDAGRILQIDLLAPVAPTVLVETGAAIDGWQVQELIDLAADETALYALDRAGDVYRYDFSAETWSLDRFDRDVRDISAHYYVALDAGDDGRTLAETSYKFALNYGGAEERLWSLPDGREIDIAADQGATYALLAAMDTPVGDLRKYRDTATVTQFNPNFAPVNPRQLVAAGNSVTVLDQAGRRLLQYDATTGRLKQRIQFADRTPISAFWTDGTRLILAGRDTLYFVDEPQRAAEISGGDVLIGPQPHDLATWLDRQPKILPLGINLAERDFQMPGAPRHYRLGIHAGFDLYFAAGTQIQAAADGVVIRADHDYVAPDPTAFDAWRGQSFDLGYTSAEAEDFYRGRQVWVQHDDGTIGRYVHLSSIDPFVYEGERVTQGQIIARVGNSGSPASRNSETEDAHLHFELWSGDHYLGQWIRPIETRAWGQQVLR
ncbi:MAG: M23 family metallopeptidase [Anaerolineae bacterium]|nr:M23 family metallopeptidase [Anaerolineae bacterium]